eukprot:10290109-Alexandrium_andersonii.AAC.1
MFFELVGCAPINGHWTYTAPDGKTGGPVLRRELKWGEELMTYCEPGDVAGGGPAARKQRARR